MPSSSTVSENTGKRTSIVALISTNVTNSTALICLKRYAKDLCSPVELADAVHRWNIELNPVPKREAVGQLQQQLKEKDRLIVQLQQKLIEVAAIAQKQGVHINLELSDKGFSLCSSKKSS